MSGPHLVPGLVHRRRGHPERGHQQRIRLAGDVLEGQGLQHFARPGHPGPPPARQTERDVGPQLTATWRPAGPVAPAQRSTAAASADPPPNPAPAGMRLTRRT